MHRTSTAKAAEADQLLIRSTRTHQLRHPLAIAMLSVFLRHLLMFPPTEKLDLRQ